MASDFEPAIMQINDLPVEMLIKIFTFLSPEDRREASLTCKRWLDACQHPVFLANRTLNFNYCLLDQSCPPFSIFLRSTIEYQKLILGGDIEFSDSPCDVIWEKFGNCITEITFDYCPYLSVELLCGILRRMKRLKRLHIFCKKEFFFNGNYIIDVDDQEMLRALEGVIELSLSGTNLTDKQFFNLLVPMRSLEALNLFFSNEEDKEPNEGEHYLTCTDILDFVESRSGRLKDLNLDDFGYQIIDEGQMMDRLMSIESLRLRKVCFPMERSGARIGQLLEQQNEVVTLGMSYGVRMSCESLKQVPLYLPGLRELNLRDAVGKMDGLKVIQGLGELDTFRLANYTNAFEFNDGHIAEGLTKKPKLRRFELSCSSKICSTCLVKMTENFFNLRVLKLTHSKLDDQDIQIVFKNLRWLRKLSLTGCRSITDVGIIGWRRVDDSPNAKKAAMEEYSLANLKGLRSLDIAGLEDITNTSLLLAFHLPELKKLKASNLKKISELGIEALTQNCANLEALDFGGCENLNDVCMELLARNLRRLKFLDIHGCRQLSDQAWQLIAVHCKRLQILYAWNCDMSIFLSDMLFSKCETLKLVYYERKRLRFQCFQQERRSVSFDANVAGASPGGVSTFSL